MSTYFISDLHLGHVNMSIKRGFASIELHDNHIMQNLETAKQVPYTLFFIYLFLLVFLSIQYHCIKKNIAKQQET